MTIIRHELRQNRNSLWIWTGSICFMMVICVLIYPDMKSDMDSVGEMFATMGAFSAAFGMDRINFGQFMGFYCVECGNILGLGGAFFAALLGISALAGEEKEHTAEFLLTHPVSRTRVVGEKLAAVLIQILILNAAALLLSLLAALAVGEKPGMREFWLLHLAYTLLQFEIACVCFGISAFISGGSLGLGMGVAICLYFMNIIANITEGTEFLKNITPFGYAEGADILYDSALNGGYLAVGAAITAVGIALAFFKYCRKDIKA